LIYRTDLHIHTVLSPCGDIEMTPRNIVKAAKERGLHIIGITDHNTTLQCAEVKKVGEREGLYVLCGVELNTREEVHALAFFETPQQLAEFQIFLDNRLPHVRNKVDKFGYQLVINEEEEVLQEIDYLLFVALTAGIEEVEAEVHRLSGIFIPAHINRMQNSVLSQLGFLPPDLKVEALDLSRHTTIPAFLEKNKYLSKHHFIQSSDAHFLEDIGAIYTELEMDEISFSNIREALSVRREPILKK
jgi:predicted metal-dependent phosphoesterase TrpH